MPEGRRPLSALLTLDRADLGYRGFPILHHVELGIRPGDFVAMIGANGSGKTTLLRALLGVLPPLDGRVVRAPELKLGYVPQVQHLDPLFPLSVREVVEMGLWRGRAATRGVPAADRAFARDCMRQVQMEEQATRLFSRLSGGQQQRVLVARALACRPNLLLLDEPTSGVDARAAEIVFEALSRLRAEGAGILIVTHHPLALGGRASRALLLRGGRVEERDPQELLTPEGLLELQR